MLSNPTREPGEYPSTASLRVKELEQQLLTLNTSLICAFNQLLDLKDASTGYHSTRLAEWAVRVAQQLDVEEHWLKDIEVAAILHDIGKIGIPDAILRKPGRLSPEEFAIMKKHPEYGWAIVRLLPNMERTSLFILHHHESYDGTGYPGGLKGAEIPTGARIVSVIDTFDAMVSARPYRKALPFEEALRRLIRGSGTQFDPAVIQCFIRIAQAEMPGVYAATGSPASISFLDPSV